MIKTQATRDTGILQEMLDRIQNPNAVLESIGKALVTSTKTRIEKTKVSPDGKPFAPWALSTLIARKKEGTTALGILHRTGSLSASIVYEVQGRSVIVKSTSPYAGYLQDGTSKMPARPFIGISGQNRGQINLILKNYLKFH